MREHRTRLFALLLAAILVLLTSTCAFAVVEEPLEPTRPATEKPLEEPVAQEPVTQEPVTQEPTTEEPTTQPTTQHTHAFGAWKTVRRATAKQAGQRQRVCSCGKKQTKKIARVTTFHLKYTSRVYTGNALKNVVSVKDSNGNTLKKGRDYTLAYKNIKNVGQAPVIFTGKGNYKFSVKRTYKILPRATAITKAQPAATKATVEWKRVSKQCTGYQIQYATDKNFQQHAATRKVNGAKNASFILSGLKEKTTYYVRIRTFKTVKNATYVSAWSKAKTFRTVSASPHEIDGQLPKTSRVSSAYFDDAVFIGDSVSLGLNYYEAANDVLGKAQFLTAGSLGSGNALQPVSEKSVHPRYNGQKMKVEKAVAACGAKKVYIMLGMNDIGAYGVEKSAANFRTLCKKILQEAPYVKIYVESVTPRVKQGANADNGVLNNKNITRYNEALAAICAAENWYFVNVAEVMFDSTGYLNRSYCSDPNGMGMHFAAAGCKVWVDYLYTHTA